MLRNTMKTIGTIAIFAGLTTCTTGPQVQKPVEGQYEGALNGAPPATITLNCNNGHINGTGTIREDTIFRSGSAEFDFIITGTYKNSQITAMSATVSFEFNITAGATPTWIAATAVMNFHGEFTKNGGAQGAFSGETSIDNLNFNGILARYEDSSLHGYPQTAIE